MHRPSHKAFTLIELLIVVAIIAILAAIAVPNFLEAQTRAKTSRAKNDMRVYATALEAYYIDFNGYPPCSTFGIPGRGVNVNAKIVLERLSTPVAYLTSGIMPNPFRATERITNATSREQADSPSFARITGAELALPEYQSYLYQSANDGGRTAFDGVTGAASFPAGSSKAHVWFLHSPGPSNRYHNLGGVLANSTRSTADSDNNLSQTVKLIYDPSNGTVSFGAIWRVGGNSNSEYGYFVSQAVATQR